MTLQDLFDSMASNPTPVLIYFIMLPVTAFIISIMTKKDEGYESPWKYLYSALIYMVCLPGIFAITMCIYHLLIDGRSFLQLNVLAYFLPIFSMIVTLFLIGQKVELQYIPGFNRISGLVMVIAACFITILILQRTRIWVVFGGSVTHLFGLFVVLFIVFRWGMSKALRQEKPIRTSRNREINVDNW